jgi:hypothetical protein
MNSILNKRLGIGYTMTNKTLPKPSESNPQVREYMSAVRKGLNSLFVVETQEGWSVRPAAEPAKSVVFTSKADALQKAKEEATPKQGEIFIFDQNGALLGQI